MSQRIELYTQMGIAAILPGLTRALEMLQAEVDEMRAMLERAQKGGVLLIKRRGRPTRQEQAARALVNGSAPVPTAQRAKRSAGAAGYWAKMTPEQRSAEIKRRRLVAAKNAGKPKKKNPGNSAAWTKLSKKAKAARIAAMNTARLAKMKTEARVQ